MKIVKKEEVKKVINSDTSQLLEYSLKLQDKDLDFCINTIKEDIHKKDIVPI